MAPGWRRESCPVRQLYCVVAMPVDLEYVFDGKQLLPIPQVPTVVGPFKTKTQARNAGERDWGAHPRMRYAVVPLFGYSDASDKQISLTYERMYDPDLQRRRAAKQEKTDHELHLEEAARVKSATKKKGGRKRGARNVSKPAA